MRKVAVVLGLVGVGFLLLLATPQLGVSQMNLLALQEPEVSPEDVQLEIAILRTINEMELTQEQMTILRDNISQIRADKSIVDQANFQLREFLLEFNGTREELAEQIVPHEERVSEARQAFQENMYNSLDEIRDVLSMRQGDILRDRMSLEGHVLEQLPRLRQLEEKAMRAWQDFNFDFNANFELDEEALEELEHKLEMYEDEIEEWGEHIGEWGEQLGEQLERLFERTTRESRVHVYQDGHTYEYNYSVPNAPRVEVFRLPEVNVKVGHGGLHASGDMLSTISILEHLEVWERVLTQKLEHMNAQQVPDTEDSI